MPNEIKSYIGVKMVDAYPEEREGKPGYVVIYPDGYKSWSPKSVFEKAYFPLHKRNSLNYEDIHAFTSKGVLRISSFESATVATIEYPNGFKDTQSCTADKTSNGHDITQCLFDLKTRLWTHMLFIMDWATNGLTNHNKDDSKRSN